MLKRKVRYVSLLVVILLVLTTITPALADVPFTKLVWEDTTPYDYTWFSCGDFDVQNVGVHHTKIKLKVDDDYNLLRNNAQTSIEGKIINSVTGKYLVERGQWTWNMFFEDNISTKSVLAGLNWLITTPKGGLVWLDTGVEKYVGIYINLLTWEIILTDPYHVSGPNPDYAELEATICEALR